MKKLALALVCLVSVAFFASCDPTVEHPEPTIALLTGEGYITGTIDNPQTISIMDETNWCFGFHAASNAETNKDLASLKVSYEYLANGMTITADSTIDLTGQKSFDFVDYVFLQESKDIILEVAVTATVTDAAGQVNTANIAYKIDQPDLPLEPEPVMWTRRGSDVDPETANDLAYYGLQWTGSYKEIFATLEVLNDDVKMYLCDGEDFESITTEGEKSAYFNNLYENGETIKKYRNITTNNSADYNDMLAIDFEGDLYLINITHATITPITNNGTYVRTDITIDGIAK